MKFPKLTRRQQLEAASVGARAEWLTIGGGKHTPHDQAVTQLLGLSNDPEALGQALGHLLHRAEDIDPFYRPAADLLRECGADEQIAGQVLEWNRQRAAAQKTAKPSSFDTPGRPALP